MPSDPCNNALLDIRDNILRAREFVEGHNLQSFLADLKTFYAVTRAVEIISEASKRLPEELRDRHSHLPWRDIRDVGNFYRHQYDNVEATYVWRTVHESLEALLIVVTAEIER